ncbi:OLC1v1001462C1 [Oldenlandia corymbosa var. corymbosa]|uniref:OLC1v1001462C1 n=1 Tax=Oldenlandia corymbosa var. corymbosa TaxID=529605 RepID=A0AAV1D7V6_OLDCO|nr:OLC1v1001462C1 [Oldenlandia corymbosa var. corymbosa]
MLLLSVQNQDRDFFGKVYDEFTEKEYNAVRREGNVYVIKNSTTTIEEIGEENHPPPIYVKPKKKSVRKGPILLEWKKEVDQEFLDLLELPFKNACGTMEGTPEGEVAAAGNSPNAEGSDLSIPVPNHPHSTLAGEVADCAEQLHGKLQPDIAVESEKILGVNKTTAGGGGGVSHPKFRSPAWQMTKLNLRSMKTSFLRTQETELMKDDGGGIGTGYDGVAGAIEDQELHKHVGREGTLHEDAPENDAETLTRVYTLCRDQVLFDEFVSNMMMQDTGETNFNVDHFDGGTSWASQPGLGDNDARTNAPIDDISGSSEGLETGKTVKGQSSKSGNGRNYTRPKRVVKELAPDDGSDISQENGNVEPQKKPNSEDESDAQAGRFTDFRSLDGVPQFRIADKFGSKDEFKNAIKHYIMLTGRPVYMYTNDYTMLRAKCIAPCKWFLYVKKTTIDGIECFCVHSIKDIHTDCTKENTNKKVTARWLATTYKEKIRADHDVPVVAI